MLSLFWNGNISPLQKLSLFRIRDDTGAFAIIIFVDVVRYRIIAIGSAIYGSVQTVARCSLETCFDKDFFWRNRNLTCNFRIEGFEHVSFWYCFDAISSLNHMMCHNFLCFYLQRRQSAFVHYIQRQVFLVASARSVAFLPIFRHGYHSYVCFFWPRIVFSEKPSQEKFRVRCSRFSISLFTRWQRLCVWVPLVRTPPTKELATTVLRVSRQIGNAGSRRYNVSP